MRKWSRQRLTVVTVVTVVREDVGEDPVRRGLALMDTLTFALLILGQYITQYISHIHGEYQLSHFLLTTFLFAFMA